MSGNDSAADSGRAIPRVGIHGLYALSIVLMMVAFNLDSPIVAAVGGALMLGTTVYAVGGGEHSAA